MKRMGCLLLLFFLMIATIVGCVFLWTTKVGLGLKIIVTIISVIFTMFIFKTITLINKNYLSDMKYEDKDEVFTKDSEKLALCPKCHQAYDRVTCFHCGFDRKLK